MWRKEWNLPALSCHWSMMAMKLWMSGEAHFISMGMSTSKMIGIGVRSRSVITIPKRHDLVFGLFQSNHWTFFITKSVDSVVSKTQWLNPFIEIVIYVNMIRGYRNQQECADPITPKKCLPLPFSLKTEQLV